MSGDAGDFKKVASQQEIALFQMKLERFDTAREAKRLEEATDEDEPRPAIDVRIALDKEERSARAEANRKDPPGDPRQCRHRTSRRGKTKRQRETPMTVIATR